MNIIWSENSTKRGAIKLVGWIVTLGFAYFKDTESALFVAGLFGIAGNAHGVLTSDNPQ